MFTLSFPSSVPKRFLILLVGGMFLILASVWFRSVEIWQYRYDTEQAASVVNHAGKIRYLSQRTAVYALLLPQAKTTTDALQTKHFLIEATENLRFQVHFLTDTLPKLPSIFSPSSLALYDRIDSLANQYQRKLLPGSTLQVSAQSRSPEQILKDSEEILTAADKGMESLEQDFHARSEDLKVFQAVSLLFVNVIIACVVWLLVRAFLKYKILQEQEFSAAERLRSMLDSPAMYVVRTDLEGKYTYANRSFLETFVPLGSRKEILGVPSLQYIIPEDHTATLHAVEQCLAHPDVPVYVTLRKPTPQNTILVTDWIFTTLRNAEGAICEFQCSGFDISMRMTLEEQLKNEREQTIEIMNAIHVIVWEADAETFEFSYVSNAAERLLGYPTKQWTTEPLFWQNHIHPDDRAAKVRFCIESTRALRDHDFEYRFIKADGSIAWLRDMVTVVVRDGRAVTLRGVMVDITEQKAMAKELRTAEEHFRSAVNALGEGIVMQDIDGKIAFCNARAEEILGLSVAQMSGHTSLDPLWRTVHEDGTPFPGNDHPAMVTLRTGEAQKNIVMGVYKPNGKLTWILINTQPIHYKSVEEVSGIVASFTDITVQKEQEEALKHSEQRYRALYSKTPVMLHSINPEGKLVSMSDHWLSTLGYTHDEAIGKLSTNFLTPESARKAKEDVLPKFFKTGELQNVAYQFVKKNGEILDTLLSATAERDGYGNIVQSMAVIQDITEQKRAEKELRLSEERFRSLFQCSAPQYLDRKSRSSILDEKRPLLEKNNAQRKTTQRRIQSESCLGSSSGAANVKRTEFAVWCSQQPNQFMEKATDRTVFPCV